MGGITSSSSKRLLTRREMLGKTLAGSALLGFASRSTKAADSRIEVLIGEPIAIIAPEIYGHFIEHLGGVIYDGVWVGEDSKVPNIGGIRRSLVEHLRLIRPSVLRWPGGCFADQYDWRDGIGPRSERPRRSNFWSESTYKTPQPEKHTVFLPQEYEPNWFGTNEFVRFCRLTGAQPYLAANVRGLNVRDFLEWVDYCNAPVGLTTLSDRRAAAGEREPFGINYWGIGNESWGGCGGNFTPEEYAAEFRRFTGWVPTYGQKLKFIASGPNGGDVDWTRRFLTRFLEKGPAQLDVLYGLGLHYYAGTTGSGQAQEYTTGEWYDLLAKADRLEPLILQHWAAMGESDPQHRAKLVVDEWGAWHKRDARMPPGYLHAYQGTLRDALVTALTLDIFNRHADKVAMANVAQLINTIHSLFLAYEDKFLATPNFHVFEMYAAHQGGQSLRTLFITPDITYSNGEAEGGMKKAQKIWGLRGSASLHGKHLVLTVVNIHTTEAREAEIVVRGGTPQSGEARSLASADIHAYNSFADPHALEPRSVALIVQKSGMLTYSFPPASITRLRFRLV